MKTLKLIGLLLLTLVGCDDQAPQPTDYVLLNTDFESEAIFPPWEKQGNPESFAIVTEDPRKGTYCAKFTIDAGELWASPYSGLERARSEIQHYKVAPAQQELYYAWSLKIPTDYIESSDWQVVGQFHDQPDYANGESWANYPGHFPPVSFTYKNGKIGLTIHHPFETGTTVISERAITKGVWNDIVLRIYWSTTSDGYIEAWINNTPMTDSSGKITRYQCRNLYNSSGNYLRLGLYRSIEITTTNSVYYDEIKSGLTFADVAND
ncbi:MAG: polysaccharide lyase [Bacteroidales bacterium]|nr:polysaccharide lyase [Bacteroidales bacterium]